MEKKYAVPATFIMSGFLAATRAGGLKLSAESEFESVNGSAAISEGVLTVSICESAGGREVPPEIGLESALGVVEGVLR